jgi:hypothetical protein
LFILPLSPLYQETSGVLSVLKDEVDHFWVFSRSWDEQAFSTQFGRFLRLIGIASVVATTLNGGVRLGLVIVLPVSSSHLRGNHNLHRSSSNSRYFFFFYHGSAVDRFSSLRDVKSRAVKHGLKFHFVTGP